MERGQVMPMPLHEAAQNTAWFVIIVVVGIALVLWHDCRKETKEDQRKKEKKHD
jgi:hypothetical protein